MKLVPKDHGSRILKNLVKLLCPKCGKEFVKGKNNTHLVKPNTYGVTCCTASCRGSLYAEIQYYGLDQETINKMQSNVVEEFKGKL